MKEMQLEWKCNRVWHCYSYIPTSVFGQSPLSRNTEVVIHPPHAQQAGVTFSVPYHPALKGCIFFPHHSTYETAQRGRCGAESGAESVSTAWLRPAFLGSPVCF